MIKFNTREEAKLYKKNHPYWSWLFGLQIKHKLGKYYLKPDEFYGNISTMIVVYAILFTLVCILASFIGNQVFVYFFCVSLLYLMIQAIMHVKIYKFYPYHLFYIIPFLVLSFIIERLMNV